MFSWMQRMMCRYGSRAYRVSARAALVGAMLISGAGASQAQTPPSGFDMPEMSISASIHHTKSSVDPAEAYSSFVREAPQATTTQTASQQNLFMKMQTFTEKAAERIFKSCDSAFKALETPAHIMMTSLEKTASFAYQHPMIAAGVVLSLASSTSCLSTALYTSKILLANLPALTTFAQQFATRAISGYVAGQVADFSINGLGTTLKNLQNGKISFVDALEETKNAAMKKVFDYQSLKKKAVGAFTKTLVLSLVNIPFPGADVIAKDVFAVGKFTRAFSRNVHTLLTKRDPSGFIGSKIYEVTKLSVKTQLKQGLFSTLVGLPYKISKIAIE